MNIAILDDYQGAALNCADWSQLPEHVHVFSMREHLNDSALIDAVHHCEVVVAMRERTPFTAALLASLPNLRLLITTGPRNASIDLDACQKLGITVCATRSQPLAAAELTWALILAASKNVPAEDRALRRGEWQTGIPTGLAGRVLGLMGLGKLGARMAQIGQAFGMEVIGWSPNLTEERAAQEGVRRVDKLTLFSQADVVSLHLILSDRTRHIVGREEFAAMGQRALFVNTSRAGLVDEDALLWALQSGQIGGAALDVHYQEPLPANAPILRAPRTLLTPHLGYVTDDNYAIYYGDALENILGWLEDRPVRVLA